MLRKETAFPRYRATDSRWNRKPVSLGSSVTAVILRPNSCVSSTARWFHVPAVSMATERRHGCWPVVVFGFLGACRFVSCRPSHGRRVYEIWIGIGIPCHPASVRNVIWLARKQHCWLWCMFFCSFMHRLTDVHIQSNIGMCNLFYVLHCFYIQWVEQFTPLK